MVWRREWGRVDEERNVDWIILIIVLGRGDVSYLPVRLRSYT